MKTRWIPALLMAFCLSACAPAASENEEIFNSTVENVQTAETGAAETAAFPVGHLRVVNYRESTADAVYNTVFAWQEEDAPVLQLLQVDLTTARRSCLFSIEAPLQESSSVVPYENSICVFANDSMYQVPQNGGEARVVPLRGNFIPDYADEYSAYDFDYTYPDSHKKGVRLNLATGEFTLLELPDQTQSIYAVGEDRFLLMRLITDVPLPDSRNWEQYEAVCQNATAEYDWYDPATGELETIWQTPYYGIQQPDGSKKRYSLLGMAGDRLYFDWFAGDGTIGGTESCAADGTDWQALPGQPGNERSTWTFTQNGSLRWLMGGSEGSLWIYDLADGQVYEMPHITGTNGWPELFVGQDQVMVAVGTEPYVVSNFAFISTEDYLAGSTDWTPVVPCTGTS